MIRRELNDTQTLMKGLHYPALFHRMGGHQVLLGIGGNIGNVVRRFEHLLHYLKRSSRLRVIETAAILKNPPFGYKDQPYFYNSLMLIETLLKPKALLRYLLHVEKVFGRKRLFKDAPRTLDIDILFYENVKMNTKELTLPHPEWMNRDSVLIPLLYMKGSVK